MDLYSGQMEVQAIVEKGVKVGKKGERKDRLRSSPEKFLVVHTGAKSYTFCPKNHLNFVKNETLKIQFLLKNSGFENVN